jgi:hypothetical protein
MSITPGMWKQEGTTVFDSNGDAVAECDLGDNSGHETDNARLCAAAPFMKGALQRLLAVTDGGADPAAFSLVIGDCRTALALADLT